LRLSVFARAGHDARLEWTVHGLAQLGEAPAADSLAAVSDFLIERRAWESVRALLEAFPEVEPGWASSFIEHWATFGDPVAIDRWLALRARTSDVWFCERVRYRVGSGTASELFVELSDAIRAEPETAEGWRSARRLGETLRAVAQARPERFAHGAPRPDDAWLVEIAARMDAFPCYALAEALIGPWPEASASLFELALEAPFGHADARAVASREADPSMAGSHEETLRAWARIGLARAERERDLAWGVRVLESLVGCTQRLPDPLDSERSVQLLLHELGDVDPRSYWATELVNHLCRAEPDMRGTVRAGDQRLWRLLAAREWGGAERSLLELLLEVAGDEAREKVWRRAEVLAAGDAQRARELGRAYTRAGRNVDAARQLAAAVLGMPEGPEGKERAAVAYELFQARLALGEWEAAESVWPIARDHLDASEAPLVFGALSLAAARCGDSAAALRLWARRANLDRGDLRGARELARILGRGPLIQLYAALAREDPFSTAPREAIERLLSDS
jgi:hypothetical protein